MPRSPYEKDTIDGLRDLREQFMKLNNSIIALAESIDKRFNEQENDMMEYRKERLHEEIESHELALKKKSNALAHAENGTTQKMKTIASEQVKAEMGAKQINWGEIWRKNVVPALATTLAITVTLAALAVTLPGIVEILQKAFIR